MKSSQKLAAVLVAALLAVTFAAGQAASKKKSYVFKGKVEAVNETGKTLTVNGENVEGWMAAMTMAYEVDDPAVFKKVKVGDQITATVYANDMTLHKAQALPHAPSNPNDTNDPKITATTT